MAPFGRPGLPLLPAPSGRLVAVAGILVTCQCHQPKPSSASRSKRVIAKLRVPAGGSFQASAGERLLPPHSLARYLVAQVPPASEGLSSSKASAGEAKAARATATAPRENASAVMPRLLIDC